MDNTDRRPQRTLSLRISPKSVSLFVSPSLFPSLSLCPFLYYPSVTLCLSSLSFKYFLFLSITSVLLLSLSLLVSISLCSVLSPLAFFQFVSHLISLFFCFSDKIYIWPPTLTHTYTHTPTHTNTPTSLLLSILSGSLPAWQFWHVACPPQGT